MFEYSGSRPQVIKGSNWSAGSACAREPAPDSLKAVDRMDARESREHRRHRFGFRALLEWRGRAEPRSTFVHSGSLHSADLIPLRRKRAPRRASRRPSIVRSFFITEEIMRQPFVASLLAPGLLPKGSPW